MTHRYKPGGSIGSIRRTAFAPNWWVADTAKMIHGCPCQTGCPSCVQSPKCGNGNDPLDKAGAVAVLGTVLGALRRHGT